MKAVHLLILGCGLIVITAIGVFAGMTGYRLVYRPVAVAPVNQTENAIVSGVIQYNGVRPAAGTAQDGKVILYKRALGEADFTVLPVEVSLVPDATWSWHQAVSGETYELQASVEFHGQEVARSNTIVVTAPANGEQLIFNVSQDQLPDDILVADESQYGDDVTTETLPTPKLITPPTMNVLPVAISGRLNLSGYLPASAKLVLKAQAEGESSFTDVNSDIEVKDNAVWVWSEAVAGKRYQVVLELRDHDVIIGKTDPVTVAAPATNQYLQLVSSAQPPTQPQSERASVIGRIDLNGPVANNSSILILQRLPGQTKYEVIARIPAADGQTWSFDSATAGQQYELTAALQVNEQNTSSANAVTVTAPATNVTFRINTNVSLDAPGQPTLLTCGTQKADGKWPAEVHFAHVQNANAYWLQVGSAAGKDDIYNERRVRTKSNVEQIIVDFLPNKPYYVRYAQAQCIDCRSDQDYSAFSESVQFTCPN